MELLHKILWLLKPEGIQWLIMSGGLPAICMIIFAETGFFAILPGDSMLVLCGIFASTPAPNGGMLLPLWMLLTIVPLCGVLGDQVGFWLGTWFGQAMYKWNDKSILGIPLFKKSYLTRTREFYERWGVFAVVAGRWVPIVRTFVPMVAGIIRMPFRKFVTYNIIGGFTWVWSMVFLGYFLGNVVKNQFGFDLAKHIDKIALVIVILSVLPIFFTVYKERRAAKAARAVEGDK